MINFIGKVQEDEKMIYEGRMNLACFHFSVKWRDYSVSSIIMCISSKLIHSPRLRPTS